MTRKSSLALLACLPLVTPFGTTPPGNGGRIFGVAARPPSIFIANEEQHETSPSPEGSSSQSIVTADPVGHDEPSSKNHAPDNHEHERSESHEDHSSNNVEKPSNEEAKAVSDTAAPEKHDEPIASATTTTSSSEPTSSTSKDHQDVDVSNKKETSPTKEKEHEHKEEEHHDSKPEKSEDTTHATNDDNVHSNSKDHGGSAGDKQAKEKVTVDSEKQVEETPTSEDAEHGSKHDQADATPAKGKEHSEPPAKEADASNKGPSNSHDESKSTTGKVKTDNADDHRNDEAAVSPTTKDAHDKHIIAQDETKQVTAKANSVTEDHPKDSSPAHEEAKLVADKAKTSGDHPKAEISNDVPHEETKVLAEKSDAVHEEPKLLSDKGTRLDDHVKGDVHEQPKQLAENAKATTSHDHTHNEPIILAEKGPAKSSIETSAKGSDETLVATNKEPTTTVLEKSHGEGKLIAEKATKETSVESTKEIAANDKDVSHDEPKIIAEKSRAIEKVAKEAPSESKDHAALTPDKHATPESTGSHHETTLLADQTSSTLKSSNLGSAIESAPSAPTDSSFPSVPEALSHHSTDDLSDSAQEAMLSVLRAGTSLLDFGGKLLQKAAEEGGVIFQKALEQGVSIWNDFAQ